MRFLRFHLALSLFLSATLLFAEVNVGVFLPFKSTGATGKNAVEYYRGLLMAIDSLSQVGTTFKVTAADCGTTVADMNSLLNESKNGVYDIIFAPSDQQQAEVIKKYSLLNGTKVTMPFGGKYDELITCPNFYALKVTQTDYTIPTYNLIIKAFKGKKIVVVSTDNGAQICPLAKYIKNYYKGAKSYSWPDKESKILQAMADPNTIIVPSMYDENTQNNILQLARKAKSFNAVLIGYPNWYDHINNTPEAKVLGSANTYLIMQNYPRRDLPRIRKFASNYEENFDSHLTYDKFSITMWGFDTGYYLLKAVARYKQEFTNQKLYSAPLQSAFNFEPRSIGQGYINTHVLLLHYKADGTQEIIESNSH